MMYRLLLLGLMAVPLTSVAGMYDAEYEACHRLPLAGIFECVVQAGEKWDKQLNASYKDLIKRSYPWQNEALKKAQRLWIQYRDANCSFYAETGGSMGQMDSYECVRAMTKARTCELDSVNRGDSEPMTVCKTSDHGSADKADAIAPSSVIQAASPQAGAASPVLPMFMKSALEGLRRQSGSGFVTSYSKSKYNRDPPNGFVFANVHFEEEVQSAGGSAIFGWMEGSDQVVLMTHAKYLPALTLAATQRSIEFVRPLERLDQTPRYLMTCVWQRENDQITPSLRVYAERDDANSSADIKNDSLSMNVKWVEVPASRAEKRFAVRDYCSDISTTETTTAPLWEDALR